VNPATLIMRKAPVAAAGGFPTTLAGLVIWCDASDAASITHSAGAVSQWSDKSGNARHILQASAALKPVTGLTQFNGLNVLTFNGAKAMHGPSAQYVNGTTGEWTAFIVLRQTTTGSTCAPFNAMNVGNPVAQMLILGTGWLQAHAYNTADAMFQHEPGTIGVNTIACVSSLRTATTVDVRKNGVAGGTTATTGTPKATAVIFNIGAAYNDSQNFVGEFAEFFMYNRALNSTERANAEAYLKTKWGIP